jgi:hypothetical protein
LLALAIFVWRRRLYRWDHLMEFILTGRIDAPRKKKS